MAAPAGATPNYDGALDTSFGAGGLADYASLGRLKRSALGFGATRVGATTIGYLVDEGQGGLGSTQYATALLLDAGRPVIAGPNYRYPDSDGLIDTMLVRLDADLLFVDSFDASAAH